MLLIVPDYDIIQVINQRKKRSPLSPRQELRISAFGKNFDLTLEPNNDVITEGGLFIERRTTEGLLTKEIYLPPGRFFIGHVTSDPNSHVAVRETGKKGQLVRHEITSWL